MADDDCCDLLCLDLEQGEALRGSLPEQGELERVAQAAQALGDPTRLALALALREGGELCVCDLAWVAARSEKLVSHHLRLLRSAGLVQSRREGRMVFYATTNRGRALIETLLSAQAKAR